MGLIKKRGADRISLDQRLLFNAILKRTIVQPIDDDDGCSVTSKKFEIRDSIKSLNEISRFLFFTK